MLKPIIKVGQAVQYFTQRTLSKDRTRRLPEPERVGPFAALVTEVNEDYSLSLCVFHPSGRLFPAFKVTQEPTTPVQHFWREV